MAALLYVTPCPQRFTYKYNIDSRCWAIFEGENFIAAATEQAYAAAICNALNSYLAILANMPIKLGRSNARN